MKNALTEAPLPEVQVQMLFILRELYNDAESAHCFTVDGSSNQAHKPLNLGAVTNNVVIGKYHSLIPFIADVHAVWSNCKDHDCEDTSLCDICTTTDRLSSYFEDLCSVFLRKTDHLIEHIRDTNQDSAGGKHVVRPVTDSESDNANVPGDDSGYEEEDEAPLASLSNQLKYDPNAGYEVGSTMKSPLSSNANNTSGQFIQKNGDGDDVILPKDNGITLLPNGRYSKTIRIAKFSMAQHLSQVLKWNEGGDRILGGGDSGKFPSVDPIHELFVALENHHCGIEVIIDKHKRKQKVMMVGDSVVALRKLSLTVCDVMSLLTSNRKIHRFSDKWKPAHREAIIGSVALQDKIFSLRSAVVFHIMDNAVMAEIVGASCNGVKQMCKYLQSLQPIVETWSFPGETLAPEHNPQFWNSIRSKFAVRFVRGRDFSKNGLTLMKIEASGFAGESYMTGAHEALSFELGQSPMKVAVNETDHSNASSLNHTSVSAFRNNVSSVEAPFAVYKFKGKDRHASHFFSSYEKLFQRFFLRKYNVTISCFCTTAITTRGKCGDENDTGNDTHWKDGKVSDEENGNGGLCMLDLRSPSMASIQSVKHYLSHMMEHLAIQQVLFESVSGEDYRRIVQEKQRTSLAFFSSGGISAANVSDAVLDPLAHDELVSLRMEPPLIQVHGSTDSREKNFPVDVVLYICSPVVTSKTKAQHTSNKAKHLTDSFRNLKKIMKAEKNGGNALKANHARVTEVMKEESRSIELEDLDRVRRYFEQEQSLVKDTANDFEAISKHDSTETLSIKTGGVIGSTSLSLMQSSSPRKSIEGRGVNHVSFQSQVQYASSPTHCSVSRESICGRHDNIGASIFSPSASTSTNSSLLQSFNPQVGQNFISEEVPLTAPIAPSPTTTDWRNTVRLIDIDRDPVREPRMRRTLWDDGFADEDRSLSDDISCFSSHSFNPFSSPLSVPSTPGMPGRCSMSPASFSHAADVSINDEESALGRACIIDSINVIIDEDDGSGSKKRDNSLENKPQYLPGTDIRGTAVFMQSECAAPLSYTEALLTPHVPPPAEPSENQLPSSQQSSQRKIYQRSVHWPHLSFKYMFLAPSMKTRIQSTIKAVDYKYRGGIEIICPYRDKKDPSACLLVSAVCEGEYACTKEELSRHESEVDTVVLLFDQVLKETLEETQTVQLVLKQSQYDKLTEDTLAVVKTIQGEAGVHILLSEQVKSTESQRTDGPLPLALDLPSITMDWRRERFPTSDDLAAAFHTHPDSHLDMKSVASTLFRPEFSSCSGGGDGRDTIAVQIPSISASPSSCTPQNSLKGNAELLNQPPRDTSYVEIAVQGRSGSDDAWCWGSTVNSLFAVVDDNDTEHLDEDEKKQIAGGDILVTGDFKQGDEHPDSVILRAQASVPRGGDIPKDQVEQYLRQLVFRAIQLADNISLSAGGPVDCKGLVIVPPITIPAFTFRLSTQDIEVCCVRASVEYVQTHRIRSLQRIVCLEAKEFNTSPSFVAKYLFQLVKSNFNEKRDSGDELFTHLATPFISVCRDSTVLSMIDEEVKSRNIAKVQKLHKKPSRAIAFSVDVPDPRRRGTHMVLVRGTPTCLHSAISLILKHVAPHISL